MSGGGRNAQARVRQRAMRNQALQGGSFLHRTHLKRRLAVEVLGHSSRLQGEAEQRRRRLRRLHGGSRRRGAGRRAGTARVGGRPRSSTAGVSEALLEALALRQGVCTTQRLAAFTPDLLASSTIGSQQPAGKWGPQLSLGMATCMGRPPLRARPSGACLLRSGMRGRTEQRHNSTAEARASGPKKACSSDGCCGPPARLQPPPTPASRRQQCRGGRQRAAGARLAQGARSGTHRAA